MVPVVGVYCEMGVKSSLPSRLSKNKAARLLLSGPVEFTGTVL
jgi:hypothetical protein